MNKKQKPTKSRNPSWRAMDAIRKSGASGSHRDKKKDMKQGKSKHRGKEMEEAYDHPQGGELSRMGRILMDKSVTTKDDALSNVMSRVGDELTRYGAPGGARSIEELEKRTKLPKEKIMKLMKWAQGQKDDSLSKVKDPKPDDGYDPDDDNTIETAIGHVDDERHMIRKELYQAAKYAKELFEMLENLPEDSDFPHWWQSKVTKSLQMLSKAKHYLENEIAVPEAAEAGQDNMGFTDKQIKMAYGVLNDPRYKSGNMTGAVDVINKIAPGLADHPGVAKALRTTNEGYGSMVSPATRARVDAKVPAPKQDPKTAKLQKKIDGMKKKKTNEAVCSECNKPRFVALPESIRQQYESVNEAKQKGVDGKVCWKGYKRMGTKKKGGKTVDNCVKM